MTQMFPEVAKLNILSERRLADLLSVPTERLVEISLATSSHYKPFSLSKPVRPFPTPKPPGSLRNIDNPQGDTRWVQNRIYQRLLKPICFPAHIMGAVRNRSVYDNAHLHLGAKLLVTIDIKACFPSITNKKVFRVWRDLLGCSPPVAQLLTRLTTFKRYLPQGAPTSPSLANLFIWLIDEPIRLVCADASVTYSTWIDDLAFSGDKARDLIPVAAAALKSEGFKISRKKVRIMGPSAVKILAGTRLGGTEVRAPNDKISRARSGIHKLGTGLVSPSQQERYINSLVGQLRYIEQLYPADVARPASLLASAIKGCHISKPAKKYIAARAGL
jgi:RNA-directed DNA polymerase